MATTAVMNPRRDLCFLSDLELPTELGKFIKCLDIVMINFKDEYVPLTQLVMEHDSVFRKKAGEYCKDFGQPSVERLLARASKYVHFRYNDNEPAVKFVFQNASTRHRLQKEPFNPFKYFNQPVLDESFNYLVSIHKFGGHQMIRQPAVYSNLDNVSLSDSVRSNLRRMEIGRLTSCQSYVMPLLFQDSHQGDIIIKAPHHSGLTSAIAIPLITRIQHIKRTLRRPYCTSTSPIRPIAIIIAEQQSSLKSTSRIFNQVGFDSGVIIQGFWNADFATSLEKCRQKCDILVVTPTVLSSLSRGHTKTVDNTYLKYIFIDWADKIMENFGIPDTCSLVNHYAGPDTVRIFGCEYLYESRKVHLEEAVRSGAFEVRVEKPSADAFN